MPWFETFEPVIDWKRKSASAPTAGRAGQATPFNAAAQAQGTSPTSVPMEFQPFADVFETDYTLSPPTAAHGVEFQLETENGALPPPASPYLKGIGLNPAET